MPLSHPDRILVLAPATGKGHLAIASAIKRDLDRQLLPRIETEIVNPFVPEYGRRPLSAFINLYGPVIRRAPALYSFFYHLFQSSGRHNLGVCLARSQLRPSFVELVTNPRNRAIITAHPIFPRLIAPMLPGEGGPVAVSVSTDLGVAEPGYVSPRFARFAAMTEDVARDLVTKGAPADRVVNVGYIFDREAVHRGVIDRPATRCSLGLGVSEGLVLLAGGGDGAGALDQMVDALLEVGVPAKLAVVCGANASLHRRLVSDPRYRSVLVRAVAPDFKQLLGAADVLVTKAGASTIMEAVSAGTQLVLMGSVPGQEKTNATYVERHGHGVVADSLAAAVEAVREALARPWSSRRPRLEVPPRDLVAALLPEMAVASRR